MLVSVTERTREIGIRRAVGARRSDILSQFVLEAVVLCGLGGLGGILIGVAASKAFGGLSVGGLSLTPIIQASSILAALGVSVVIGVFFGMYPAHRASRLSPIDALRYE
jgi:putative ABC transport system permease protein